MEPTPTIYQWFSDFAAIQCGADVLRRRLVVIAGPSGAGKSVLASALTATDPTYVILRNYTTRPARPTDHSGHFAYLSDEGFLEAQTDRQFVLSRIAPRPRYGYKAEELRAVLAGGRGPVLLFRHSGTKYLSECLGGVPTVFIEGEPALVASHSRNTESPPSAEDVRNTIRANRQLQEVILKKGWPCLHIINHYLGEAELHAIAQTVREFLSAAD